MLNIAIRQIPKDLWSLSTLRFLDYYN
jgi:hypothetical protein